MLRQIALSLILVVTFFGIGCPCFSEEIRPNLKEWQSESLIHLGLGNAHLLAHEPWQALEDFQRASSLLNPSDNSSFVISFLISFGQAIAYDYLEFRDQCKQAIGSLFFAFDGYDDEESTETGEESNFNSQESGSSLELLRNLASIAPSPEVRELLFSIVDEIEEELLPSFEFAKSPFLGNTDWFFEYETDNVSIAQCKSWWKKAKKWGYEILEFLHLVEKATKTAKDIKKNLEGLRNSNQYQNSQQFESNYRIN